MHCKSSLHFCELRFAQGRWSEEGGKCFPFTIALVTSALFLPLFHRSALWNHTEIVLKVALFLNSFSPCLSVVASPPHSTFINSALWIKNKDNTGIPDLSKTNLLNCFGQTHKDKQRIVNLIHHDLFSQETILRGRPGTWYLNRFTFRPISLLPINAKSACWNFSTPKLNVWKRFWLKVLLCHTHTHTVSNAQTPSL